VDGQFFERPTGTVSWTDCQLTDRELETDQETAGLDDVGVPLAPLRAKVRRQRTKEGVIVRQVVTLRRRREGEKVADRAVDKEAVPGFRQAGKHARER
jgi:hypothetical protein